MHSTPQSGNHHSAYRHPGPYAALLGWVLGTALQLQQSALWPAWAYAALALPGCFLAVALWIRSGLPFYGAPRAAAWVVATVCLGFAVTGMRGVGFESQSLQPALEGRDVLISGVVTDMPQRNEAGLRFTLAVDAATLDGEPVSVPPHIDVGWYAGVYFVGGEKVLFATDAGVAPARETNGVARQTASRVGAMLREQWVVSVALAPLILLLFGQVSLVGLLANVVAVPSVTLVVTPLAMLGVLVPLLWDLAGAAIGALMALLQWLAALP